MTDFEALARPRVVTACNAPLSTTGQPLLTPTTNLPICEPCLFDPPATQQQPSSRRNRLSLTTRPLLPSSPSANLGGLSIDSGRPDPQRTESASVAELKARLGIKTGLVTPASPTKVASPTTTTPIGGGHRSSSSWSRNQQQQSSSPLKPSTPTATSSPALNLPSSSPIRAPQPPPSIVSPSADEKCTTCSKSLLPPLSYVRHASVALITLPDQLGGTTHHAACIKCSACRRALIDQQAVGEGDGGVGIALDAKGRIVCLPVGLSLSRLWSPADQPGPSFPN